MIVSRARVRDYKSISDTGDVALDDAVTCLVGKNESGKTAFLEALYRINPVGSGPFESFDGLRDYPRMRWARDKARVPAKQPIEVTLELTNDDVAALESQFGKNVIQSHTVTRFRNYANEPSMHLEVDSSAAMRHRLARGGLDPKLADGCETFAELAVALGALDAGEAPAAPALASEFASYDVAAAVRKAIAERYPRFLYFDQYSVLPGRVSVPRLQGGGDLNPSERTALALLRLAGVETAAFSQSDYEARKAELEAASNEITREVFEYWSQNKNLLVELDLDFTAPATPEGYPAPFLEIRIRNLRHGITLNFSERSAGFVWFFSFLVAFSEYRDSDSPLVLLLDEPGLGLHAAAQLDLLRYIDERLAPDHQVVYTTHSPFMIDPRKLQRVRTVEDIETTGTTISEDVLATSSDTLFPLQAALGYDLAQTLFVGVDNLVVEGPADYLYLTVMSEHLRGLGRASLNPRWTIVPVGGLDKIPTFVALLGAQLNVTVVMDAASGGSQKIDSLVKRGIIEKNKVIPLNTITSTKEADIEDLFDEAFYLRLLKATGIAVTKSKLAPGNRIVPRVEQSLGGPFDHYRPARHLLEKQVSLLAGVDEATLARFEMLIQRLNLLLS
jgi:hypothetical protein